MLHIKQNSDKTVTINERVYKTSEELKGVRDKFWIDAVTPYSTSAYGDSHILVKFNRNGLSCEDYGEVLYSALARSAGFRCTEYQLVEFVDKQGNLIQGVACPSYKRNDKEFDISGYDLQRFQHALSPDKPDIPYNTVDSYIQCMKECMNLPNETMLQYLEEDLIKIAFFDYICGHTDRHWDNISFVYNNHKTMHGSYEAIRVADCYDSGCSFMLKRKREAVTTYANELKSAKKSGDMEKYESICQKLSEKAIPKFGITTSMSEKTYQRDNDFPEYPKFLGPTTDPNWEENFLDELCAKIADNPRLSTFIISNRQKFTIENANRLAQLEGNEIPDDILMVAGAMVDTRLKTFEKHMDRYIEKLNHERSE